MLRISLKDIGRVDKQVQVDPEDGLSIAMLHNLLQLNKNDLYFVYNGKRLSSTSIVYDGLIHAVPRLLGGKGGFGSMLRAIGAQIEKTTNREACRDLSGRRLRDINEEKRLKSWINKKAEREREAAERRRKKLEKLRAEPKHEFTDKNYEEERSKLTDTVHNAVEQGFKVAKNTPEEKKPKSSKPKSFMFEEEDLSDSSVDDSEEEASSSEVGKNQGLKRKVETNDDSSVEKKRALIEELNKTDSNEVTEDVPGSSASTSSAVIA